VRISWCDFWSAFLSSATLSPIADLPEYELDNILKYGTFENLTNVTSFRRDIGGGIDFSLSLSLLFFLN
jgi:hypothetical protein